MATTTKTRAAALDPAASLRRSVLALALPAVGEQILNTLVGLADTFLVGHLSPAAATQLGYSSSAALAGVGLANQIVWLITVLFMAVSIGSTALIARATGAGDGDTANRVLHQSLLLGLFMGVLATAGALALSVPAIQMLGAGQDVLPRGVTFLRIVALTFTPAALLFIGTAALRGAGDTRTPLYVMLGVNVVNILFSWLLINGNLGAPILGVAGSAIGAAVARGTGGLVLIALLLRGRSGLKLSLDLRPDRAILRRLIRIGAPSGAEQLVFQGALLIFVRFVTSLGTAAYAAHNVVINIESLSFLPGLGYATAASALVGRWLGAREPQLAEASAYEALLQGGLMMTTLGAIMVLLPHQLIASFVADPQVIEVGATPMRIAGLFQPFLAINFILSGGLRGAGDTRWPLYTKFISTWGVRLPLVYTLLALGFGLNGIWIAMGTDFGVQALLAAWRFRAGKWKTLRV
ncbi:MAG TPA: MATE family efflux transporter [Roseiflexaceae bacterium]|nr:MATE family efflux transporter [Roseiflexaceae bacterium]